jgi:hypothetical protein
MPVITPPFTDSALLDIQRVVDPYPPCVGSRACESAVLLEDGRVLYACTVGSEIRQGYAASEPELYANGSVENVTPVFTGVVGPFSTLFRSPSGGLFLACGWTAGGPTGADGFVGVYRSPSRMGGDWVLHSTIQRYVWGRVDFGSRNNLSAQVGYPEFLPSGRWVMTAPVWTNNPTLVRAYGMRQGCYTSDNDGSTWVLRLNLGFYQAGGTYGYGQGRNVGRLNQRLFFTATGNVEGTKDHYSDDAGTTWTLFNQITGGGAPRHCYGLGDGNAVYDHVGGTVYRVIDPLVSESGPVFRSYSYSGGAFDGIIQPLGRTFFVSSHGHCVAPAAWVVGSVGSGALTPTDG